MADLPDITIKKDILGKLSIRKKSMAIETGCLTSGAIFHTSIEEKAVSVTVELPFQLEISEKEAEILEVLIHNQMELVLRPYFSTEEERKESIR
jgi:hypothetical protein